jgi:hypothetical protein
MRDARNRRSLATLLLLPLLAQCHERTVTAPGLPDEIRATAIRMHVDLKAGTVAPIQNQLNSGISYSLIGSDGVSLQTSNLSQSPLNGNRVLVRFDVAISNTLSDVILTTPTVPTPPAGVSGVVLFPFQATVTLGPSSAINPSTDWGGAPFSFFNDVNCTGASNSDCFRWEEYSAPLAPGATSAAQTVGFEINKDVESFDVVMLVAADLLNVTPGPAVLGVAPNTAQFQSTNGVNMSQPVSVVVYNTGGGTISGLTANVTYGAGQPTGWLTASLGATTAPTVLTLSGNALGLSDGTYNATVSVASAGVGNSPQTINVELTVTAALSTNAIYVSQSDPNALDDATCGLGPVGTGTGNHPCRSIAQGLARSVALGRSEVRAADGRYSEAVTLVNGKNLLGGYNPETWTRHVETTNTIIDGVSSSGNHDRTVIASGITLATVFEGFAVRGAHNTKLGGNSYAIYVSGSSANLEIRRNVIYGGTGGPGPQGVAGASGGGVSTSNGIGRTSGNAATYDAKIATGSEQCDESNNRSHTNGGIWFAGVDNIGGGNGGGNSCPTSSTLTQMSGADGVTGQPGAGAGGVGGLGGTGGLDFRLESSGTVCVAGLGSQLGTNGGNGGNGANGSAASGAASGGGAVSGSHWVGATGTAGNIGSNGGGGGGGGAGGGAYWVSPPDGKDRLGGHGGGGGAGGNGGGAGGGGAGGGGAFGIFIVGEAPVVSENAIVRGTGGTGGTGGSGGTGVNGGTGAPGGLSALLCAGAGGRGGDGGRGGIGSGGGGGAGGASYAIYTSGAGTPNYCTTANNTVSGGTAGAGGQGGSSAGNAGGAGASGTLTTCSFH